MSFPIIEIIRRIFSILRPSRNRKHPVPPIKAHFSNPPTLFHRGSIIFLVLVIPISRLL